MNAIISEQLDQPVTPGMQRVKKIREVKPMRLPILPNVIRKRLSQESALAIKIADIGYRKPIIVFSDTWIEIPDDSYVPPDLSMSSSSASVTELDLIRTQPNSLYLETTTNPRMGGDSSADRANNDQFTDQLYVTEAQPQASIAGLGNDLTNAERKHKVSSALY